MKQENSVTLWLRTMQIRIEMRARNYRGILSNNNFRSFLFCARERAADDGESV